MAQVAAYQASGKFLRMIPVHPKRFEDTDCRVVHIKGMGQSPTKVLKNAGCHQRKTAPCLNAFFGAQTTVFKARQEFAVTMRGLNLATQGVFFDNPLRFHVGVGAEIEHHTPAPLWTVVEPLGNNQDGLLHAFAVAPMVRTIDILSLALLHYLGFRCDVELCCAFAVGIKNGIGIRVG